MNRDFEFRQLLRADRMGVISEATFELEMGNLEGASVEGASNGGGLLRDGQDVPLRARRGGQLPRPGAPPAKAWEPRPSTSGSRFARPNVSAAVYG